MEEQEENNIELELLDKVSGDRVKSLASELSKIEMRSPGSDAERRAAEMIGDEMRKLDLNVSLEEYETISWEHGPAKLTLSNDSGKSFDVDFMPYSPPAKEGGSKGRLVALKFGFPKEYASLDEEPSLIIADFNQDAGVHLQMLAAAKSGKKVVALGLISPHMNKAFRIDAVPMLTKPIPFPVFAITREDGKQIREICENDRITAKLIGKSKIIQGAKSANVIGRRKGTGNKKQRLVASAHHDCWYAGANDNVSSVASILEAARVLADTDLKKDIDFISFGCEEAGSPGYQYYLWGSRQYVKKHGEDLSNIACIFNCEFAGHTNSENLIIDCTPDLVSYYETIVEEISKRTEKIGCSPEFGIAVPTSSQADQLNFSLAGVPSSLIYWAWFDEYHTNLDLSKNLNADRLKLFTELLTISTYRFSQLDALPLSLTRYARITRAGHTGVSSHLSQDICKVTTPGIEHLKRVSGGLLDFEDAMKALDGFARAAADFEKKLSSSEGDELEDKNSTLLETCNILNASLCRAGGLLGENAMFPGYLEYLEELRKIKEAAESIIRVPGADLPDSILTEFTPMIIPEISIREFDVHHELALISEKRDRLKWSLQREVARVTATLRSAEECLRGK